MKKSIIIMATAIFLSSIPAQAQADTDRYRRLSICNILVKHDSEQYADEIEEQFLKIPVSEKYNDHNLSVRVVSTDGGKALKDETDITGFINRNEIASRLVARWFDRDILTGECTLDTVKNRGLYDASTFDVALAKNTVRGNAMLEDAGEDLISNTFLLMHEITYVDKNKRARLWGAIGQGLLSVAAAYTGNSDYNSLGKNVNDIVSSLKGFSVKINTRLYRLVWDDETAAYFWENHYSDKKINPAGGNKFENERSKYRLQYIGNVNSKGGTTSFLGIKEEEPYLMIRKACQRAMDSNVADLAKKYEEFRIKTPVSTVSPTITAGIGLKEGVTPDARYEVLEVEIKNGKTVYKKVAELKPVASKIWDNRFMASEELATGADLGATTFIKVSGGDIFPGMLIREINK